MMDLLKQLPKSVTEVEFDAENGLVLRYEKSEFKLETIEGADMFPMPTKKGVDENFVTIEANDFVAWFVPLHLYQYEKMILYL